MIMPRNSAETASSSVSLQKLASMVDEPDEPEQYLALGHQFYKRGCLPEATACFRRAIALDPKHPDAHNLLGWMLQLQGDIAGAQASYRTALKNSPTHQAARRSLANLLVQQGRLLETLPLWHQEVLACPDSYNLLRKLISEAMKARDLTLAGDYSILLAQLKWGGRCGQRNPGDSSPDPPAHEPQIAVTIPKLLHDIEQFQYLQRRGVLGDEFNSIIKKYSQAVELVKQRGPNARVPLEGEIRELIGDTYCRILHVRHTPRLEKVFSGSWDAKTVEDCFLTSDIGVVVIDDFLSRDALESLQRFCLESTVWSGNRYALGRLGAFLQDGFTCPLLLQIAEELRTVIPRVIGDRYPLRQLWGFKTPHELPADSTNHADFAAVNVNFWITPDTANLDPNCGGLVVYNVDAPLSWDFHTYNGRPDIIKPFLRSKQSSTVNIPYRENRAILFNSDLFHATAQVRFKPGYENRRVNITMLYGEREFDVHHPNLSGCDCKAPAAAKSTAWRSAAFARFRW
jgi:tetratricopeptide (TPR) repeat protein